MAVTAPAPGIEFGPPAALFRLPTAYHSLAPVTVGYEVSPDGQKFLVPMRNAVGALLQVIVNWQAGLKGCLPARGKPVFRRFRNKLLCTSSHECWV